MRSRLIHLPFFVAVYALSASASATVSFTPVVPAACPSHTEVNWTYNIGNVGSGTWMAQNDENDPNIYANNLNYQIGVVANEFVNGFGFRILSFDTEDCCDLLNWVAFQGPSTPPITTFRSGSVPGNTWVDVHVPTGMGAPSNILAMQFTTDISNGYAGIAINRARVCTDFPNRAQTNAATPAGAGYRYSGVLLGTNDVVRFQVPVGSTKSGDSCTLAHDTFALMGDTSAGNDFDLYVRCGADPTPSQFDFRGYSSLPQEFVHATSASCPCGSTWHVTVHSFSGSGFFSFVNQKHYASEHRSNLPASILCNAPSTTVDQYQNELTRGLRYFYGANEGTRFWDTYTLVNNNVINNSHVWFNCGTGRPHSDVCGPSPGDFLCGFEDCQAELYSNQFDGPTIAHELGHHYNCLDDEYDDGDGLGTSECGHSIMASQFYQNTNYCYCNYHLPGHNKCEYGSGDNGWDPVPATLTHLKTGAAWENLAPRSPITITSTPDNYDYHDFLFGGLYATPLVTY